MCGSQASPNSYSMVPKFFARCPRRCVCTLVSVCGCVYVLGVRCLFLGCVGQYCIDSYSHEILYMRIIPMISSVI